MHLTLGVMALHSEGKGKGREGAEEEAQDTGEEDEQLHSPADALAHLRSLQGQMLGLLNGEGLKVALGGVEVMKVRRRRRGKLEGGVGIAREAEDDDDESEEERRPGEASKPDYDMEEMADVLYVSVPEAQNPRVWALGRMIEQSFKDSGYITETRPLKLHLTIVNTSHRRPKPRGRRGVQFSYTSMKDLMAWLPPPPLPSGAGSAPLEAAASLAASGNLAAADSPATAEGSAIAEKSLWTEFGTWGIGSVELWVMGSRDAEGRYVSLGGVPLDPPAQVGDEGTVGPELPMST
ncbi:hypothetical protein CALVIDRAFT_536696 [Calocera viscosa TUFC12733]|uniref:A-kinase anchor protein 7-like phosphoesterase domain-containing protein n=1 Tax=Calocera viscosa (strain TUFC12733) TaxID=1330018 RepID=A0A167MJ27_CALVF|nr:hypothetical protein CALVIDRAFT_536696 [Calocera viscosa TUFC12733]